MRFWKSILTLFLLAVWLPATVHCELEAAGVVPMDECCETEAQGDHRCESGCETIEDGGIKSECVKSFVAPPEIWVIFPDLAARDLRDLVQPKHPRPEAFKIHHLPQFVIRTALPIRGPSFAS